MRILAVTPRVLEPADTGGRIRSLRIFEHLSRLHHVTLACLRTEHDTDAQVEAMRGCCTTLLPIRWREATRFSPAFYRALAAEFFDPIPHTVLKYRSPDLRAALLSALASTKYDVLLCDFLHMSINCRDFTFRPKVLFQHNVESEVRRGLAAHATDPLSRAYLARDAAKLGRYEADASRDFQHCIMVSEEDSQTMTRLYGIGHVSAIPSAVDTNYFQPTAPGASPSCVFLGSMDMLANQDAVLFFARRIWPRIRKAIPATFVIVGRHPPAAIRRLARELTGVTVTGTVGDVRPHVAAAQVLVVPLRIGGGTRIKIFEAMAMGIPVVSTRLGAVGLPVTDRQNISLADAPDDFAEAVIRLLRDGGLRQRMARDGRRLVESGYTWDRVAQRVAQICHDAVDRARETETAHSLP